MKKQTEMSVTINGKDVLAYPYTEKDYVQFENGSTIDEILENDLVSPTITHDETSFKVGVGDSDVSSSIVDSSVGKMVIKGSTYQNILPEPSTYVLSNDKEMFKVNEGLDDNVEIVDSVAKGAVLKGRTLVNLVDIIGGGVDTTLTTDSSKQAIKATSNGKAWSQVYVYLKFHKPNTHYLVTWDSIEGTLHSGYVGCYANDDNVALDNDLGLPRLSNKNYSTSNYIVFNTKEYRHNTDFALRFHLNGTNENINGDLSIEIKGLRVFEYQEGMENWGTTYIEGMTSCKMPILKTVGKNLFDVNNVISGHITESAGFTPTDNNAKTIDWFYCKPNTSYTVSGGNRNRWILCNTNGEETFIGGVEGNETPTITTLSDTVKFRCYVGYNAEPIDINNVQLEEGSVATTFESHKTSILTTSEEVILRKVGDVCDSYDALTGEYVQRVGVGVFDGSDDEGWNLLDSNDSYATFVTYTSLPNIKDNKDSICDKLPVQNGMSPEDGEYHAVQSFGSYINVSLSKASDVDTFKNWLAQEPITIYYPLATPITTTIEPSTIPFVYENGHIILESGSEEQSLLPTLEYSTVINRTGQIQSIANTVQKQEKQITKLEKMLIQNIVNLDYNNTLLTLNLEINEVI